MPGNGHLLKAVALKRFLTGGGIAAFDTFTRCRTHADLLLRAYFFACKSKRMVFHGQMKLFKPLLISTFEAAVMLLFGGITEVNGDPLAMAFLSHKAKPTGLLSKKDKSPFLEVLPFPFG